MQLIHPLAAGVVGAENGSARVFRRGTATRATVYGDFEASTADSSGDDIPLDATGGVVVYVNELVLVQVYDSLGELIRQFVAGEGGYAVEVISPSFTGTDYDSGARGVAKPTTAGSIFDLWLASAGAVDWEVLFSGEATPIQDALGSIYGLFYNVKSPEFGAVGDGSTNDTAAWQAAHDAAAAAGGGIVVAPPGIYNISSVLSWYTGVHLFCMPDSVMIRQTTAGVAHIAVTGSVSSPTIPSGSPTRFFGAALDSTVTNAATQVTVAHGNADEVIVDSFRFLVSAFCTGSAFDVSSATGRIQVRNSETTARVNLRSIVDSRTPGSGAMLVVDNCTVISFSGATTVAEPMIRSAGNELRVTRTRLAYKGASGSTLGLYLAGATYPLTVSDCNFDVVSGGASRYGVQIFVAMTAQVGDSNVFSGSSLTRYYQAATTDIANNRSYLALQATDSYTGSTSTFDLTGIQTRSVMLSSNYITGTPQITMPAFYYYGQSLSIALRNQSGSPWGTSMAITDWAGAGTAYNTVAAAVGLNSLSQVSVTFVAVNQDGNKYWLQMGEFAAPFTN